MRAAPHPGYSPVLETPGWQAALCPDSLLTVRTAQETQDALRPPRLSFLKRKKKKKKKGTKGCFCFVCLFKDFTAFHHSKQDAASRGLAVCGFLL